MAYNPDTGTVTYAGRTYTPVNSRTTRDAYRTVIQYAAAPGFPTGHDRTALLIAVRRLYRLPATANVHQIARTVIRGLRDED